MSGYEQFSAQLAIGYMRVDDINVFINSGYSLAGAAMMMAVALKEELEREGLLKLTVKRQMNLLIKHLDQLVSGANSSIEGSGNDMLYGNDISIFYRHLNRKDMRLDTKALLIHQVCLMVQEISDAAQNNFRQCNLNSPISSYLDSGIRRCVSDSRELYRPLSVGRMQWPTMRDDVQNIVYSIIDRR